MEDNNKGWFNYDADDAFHFERQIDGIVYGPEALVKKLQNQREALYVTTKFEDAMYGFVIADALGVPAEFKSRNSLSKSPITDMVGYGTHNVPEGTWSDDTSMVLATQDSINKCGKIDYDDIMNRFAAWYKKGEYTTDGKVFDIGITTSNAIRNYSSGKKALKCGGTGERDNGNGSLMRMIPVA
ncbi:MAG: ADP-ribosylglycohydrolase family protein, partial [Bacilli bacterium]|nr:ADP-ribosylglycohydrolase family protein [Bacilli bacterium]